MHEHDSQTDHGTVTLITTGEITCEWCRLIMTELSASSYILTVFWYTPSSDKLIGRWCLCLPYRAVRRIVLAWEWLLVKHRSSPKFASFLSTMELSLIRSVTWVYSQCLLNDVTLLLLPQLVDELYTVPVLAVRFDVPLPSRHRANISRRQPPPTLTIVAIYTLPSRTRWSWNRFNTQRPCLRSGCIVAWNGLLPQSEPLRHCRRFVRPFSSGGVSLTYLGRSLTGTVFSASVANRNMTVSL